MLDVIFFCLIQLIVLKKKSGIFICFLFKGGISEMMAFSTNVKHEHIFTVKDIISTNYYF